MDTKPLSLMPTRHTMILRKRTKKCDTCNATFYFSIDGRAGFAVPCATDTAFFCSSYCRETWLRDQYALIEQHVYS